MTAMTAKYAASIAKRRKVPDAEPIVRLEHISKTYGGVKANKDITLDIRPSRIKALLGENGAGKSTLMSILAGKLQPDANGRGRILVDGKPMVFHSPKDALNASIGMVYQHFMLVNTMTVAQNVMLGQEGSFFVKPRLLEEEVEELARRYGLDIDPRAKISDLSMGEKQRVEILRLLKRQSRVLILDEPTAVLTPRETFQLFEALWNMADAGKAIVFISHKLAEVLAVADVIAILRQGRIVDEFGPEESPSKAELANRMVGREVMLTLEAHGVYQEERVLEIRNLYTPGLEDVSLDVRKGEILAVAGVAGNGQKPLVEVVTGMRAPTSGQVKILGAPWKEFFSGQAGAFAGSGKDSWRGGLGYIPEDRQGLATLGNLDMVENVLLTTRHGFSRHMMLQREKARSVTEDLIKSFNVRTPNSSTEAWRLSGGNLQKLVLAREFFREPRIIVAEQPSQGLDVAATEEVWLRLLEAREQAGVLLITGDLNEALQLADRVAVMFRGKIMDIVDARDAKRVDDINLLMAGIRPGEEGAEAQPVES